MNNGEIDLVLIGAGRHGAEVYAYLCDLQQAGQSINLLGVVDDGKPPGPWENTRLLGPLNVLPKLLAKRQKPLHYLTATGNNQVRRQFVSRLAQFGSRLVPWTLRHRTAQCFREVSVRSGTLLAPACVVTTRTRIGMHCIVNAKASIHHDCVIGDFVNVNPAATICGDVQIGDGVYLGAGATVIDKVSIGPWSVIGAGAVVTEDIPANVTAVGVPARVVGHRT